MPCNIYYKALIINLLIPISDKSSQDQLPLEPPVLIGFLAAPVDFVLALAINFELPPCTVAFVVLVEFFAAIFLLIANPIVIILGYKYN